MMTLFRFLVLLLGTVAMSVESLWALEINKLHLPMTRDEADSTLSKDYEIMVLNDGSVRRSWKLEDKTVFVDFNTQTNEAILIAIVYDKPVPRKKGEADAHTIAAGKYDQDAGWDPAKDAESREMLRNTFGLENALRKKLKDKSMLFMETKETKTRKVRVIRVSLFSRMPSTNRWALKPVSKDAETTALGNQWSSEHLTALYNDEERRRELPLKTDDTVSPPAEQQPSITPSGSKVTVSVHRSVPQPPAPERTAMGRASGSSAATPPANQSGEKVRIKLDKGQEGSVNATFLVEPPDWLKKVGIKNPEWWHYIVLGIAALLLLITVLRSISHSMSAASGRKNFEKVVAQAPLRGSIRPRK